MKRMEPKLFIISDFKYFFALCYQKLSSSMVCNQSRPKAKHLSGYLGPHKPIQGRP